jgi:two-component system, NtrC family, sensor histidine kinase HydH
VREAVADIDDETRRLDRIVTEVLDFAKPIRFELMTADVNEVCRASAAAAWADTAGPPLRLELDPAVPPMVTDPERLRTALVNILTNARHAVDAGRAAVVSTGGGTAAMDRAGVTLATRAGRDGGVTIVVRDRGVGIAADDLAHVFDPYFTTRRTGTGLGLPIAKNIVEGLGGSIGVSSVPDGGTEIAVVLPGAPPGDPA